ncbi:MAG: tRNA-dihydrouridine synthase, partial [Synergistaceae bacterium]|nr:tRNA-dihydrouridine synthase [Synergistaceae bacterium]
TDLNKAKMFSPLLPGYPTRIGGVEAENPIWLAPLAGITFASVRKFYRNLGAGLVHTEMVSALGLCHKGRKTKELLYGSDEERPVALQLFGSNPQDIARGAEAALNIRKFEALQINMACPMPKVTKRGSGSKLMEHPDVSSEIIKAMKKTGLPIWAKIRIMPAGSSLTTCEYCDLLFESGADFIFIHGRTPAQRYEGRASREAVEDAASRFPGMIGGSGDCYEPEDLLDYLKRGCAAVLAGRGTLKDVFIIPRTLRELGADVPEKYCDPSLDFQSELLLELGRSIYNTEGQSLALMISRRMLAALFKGFSGAAQLRRRGALARTWQEMEDLLSGWQEVRYMSDLEVTKEKFPRGVIGG